MGWESFTGTIGPLRRKPVMRNDFPCHYVYMSHTDTFRVEQQWAWIAPAWPLCFVICPSTFVFNTGFEISKYSTFNFDEYEFHQSLTRNNWNCRSVQVTDDRDSCWHFIFVQPSISTPLLWLMIHTFLMISHPENIDENIPLRMVTRIKNGRYFADDNVKRIFLNDDVCTLIQILLNVLFFHGLSWQ